MKILRSAFRAAVAVVSTGLFICLAGCPKQPPKACLELAIVPGADVLVQADFKAMSQTPLGKTIAELTARQKTENAGAKAAVRMLQAMDLKEDDVAGILLSFDLDTIRMPEKGWTKTDLEKINMVFAVQLAKPVTLAQLKAGVMANASKWPGLEISDASVARKAVISAKANEPDAPAIYGAVSEDGKICYATMNGTAMEALFSREKKSAVEPLVPELASVANSLSGAQMKTALVLPETMRQALREVVDNPKASSEIGMMMALGLLNPVKSLVSFTVGLKLRDTLDISMGFGFDDEANAQQAFAVIKGAIMPMLQGAIKFKHDDAAPALDKIVDCGLQGKSMTVTFTLKEKDLRLIFEDKSASSKISKADE